MKYKKSLIHVCLALSILLNLVYVSCKRNGDVLDEDKISDPSCPYQYSRVNLDGSNPELFCAVTKENDTVIYYGLKNPDGTASGITTIEYITKDGIENIIDLNDDGYVTAINSSNGALIEFEWISATSAVVKAHSYVDNIYISTVVDFDGNGCDMIVQNDVSNSARMRKGNLSLQIRPQEEEQLSFAQMQTMSSPWHPVDELPNIQEVLLWIYQCDNSYDAKNYLRLLDATTGEMILRYTQYERLSKGDYIYKIPVSSYPAKATNKELCKNIDETLNNIQNVLDKTLVVSDQIIVALNIVAFSTGIGLIPTVVTDAIVIAANAANCGMQLLKDYGGISGLMRRTYSDWYYKEYVLDNLAISPVAFNAQKTVVGDKHKINLTEDFFLVALDMQGTPMVKSFELNPSYPGRGVAYEATAEYHCIPEGSQITLSIVGTDGYKEMQTSRISGSGTAVLYVPGAETGVCDVCEVVIDLPSGESINMRASLVFGK